MPARIEYIEYGITPFPLVGRIQKYKIETDGDWERGPEGTRIRKVIIGRETRKVVAHSDEEEGIIDQQIIYHNRLEGEVKKVHPQFPRGQLREDLEYHHRHLREKFPDTLGHTPK